MVDITLTDRDGSPLARLTTDHATSSYGKPVLVINDAPHGIGDPVADEVRLAMLLKAIEMSGLSARLFATSIAMRDERTVRYWLSGESPVPTVLYRQLWRRVVKGDIATAATKKTMAEEGCMCDDRDQGECRLCRTDETLASYEAAREVREV